MFLCTSRADIHCGVAPDPRPSHSVRRLIGALKRMAACSALGCAVSCEVDGRGRPEPVDLNGANDVAFVGCVDTDDEHERLVLWTLDDVESLKATGRRVMSSGQSTSTNGPWIGTRQLELIGDRAAAIGKYRGQRVVVSGALEEQPGTTGPTDQVQHARGTSFRRLQAGGFEPVPGPCAFDPRRHEPPRPGNPDIK